MTTSAAVTQHTNAGTFTHRSASLPATHFTQASGVPVGRKPVTTRNNSWEAALMQGMKTVGQAALKEVVKDTTKFVVHEVVEDFEGN